LLFVGYEGFGLITNAAANMAKPKRTLPRAIYGSVAIVIVIYLLVSVGVVTTSHSGSSKDSATLRWRCCEAFLGQVGFS